MRQGEAWLSVGLNSAAVRKARRGPGVRRLPAHQHPASAGVRSVQGRAHRPRPAHVDALRI